MNFHSEVLTMQTISAAFVKAKRSFGPALKDKTNPAFRSKYADLGACIDAVESALLDNGIAAIQRTYEDATGVTVETVFLHESGEQIECGRLHVPAAKQDPQGYGSALTYARRYSLMAACGIAPDDDDGNAATQAKREADNSPSAYAGRLSSGIANDDAAGAASAFYGQSESYKKSVWACLSAADKKAIAAHKTEGAES